MRYVFETPHGPHPLIPLLEEREAGLLFYNLTVVIKHFNF